MTSQTTANEYFDIDRARRETPGAANVIHLNNAGAALMPAPVVDALHAHVAREAAIGGYEAEAEAAPAVVHTYRSLAALLNADPAEIAVVENATVAWDQAFYGLAAGFGPGDRILTAEAEYASNYLAFLQVARRTGVRVEVVPSDGDGQLDTGALESMLDHRVKLIAITHVPTNGGLVNPAEAVGAIARRHGVPYLLDACQSVGQMPIDVQAIGCDFLSATARKFLRGPRGIGFLYVRRVRIADTEPPVIDLHAATWTAPDRYAWRPDARRFENWESNIAAKVALGVAADYALGFGLAAIETRVAALAEHLRTRLATVDGILVRDLGRWRCGIVTFTHDRTAPAEIKSALARARINVTVSVASSTLLDMQKRRLPAVVRASVHYYNTEDEIERAVAALRRLLA